MRSIKAQETRAGKTFFKLLALHTNQATLKKKRERNAIHNNLLNFIRVESKVRGEEGKAGKE